MLRCDLIEHYVSSDVSGVLLSTDESATSNVSCVAGVCQRETAFFVPNMAGIGGMH